MAQLQRKMVPDDGAIPKQPSKHKLDELNTRLAKHLVMFHPSETVVKDMMARARIRIPGLADPSEVLRVMRYNRDCMLAVTHKSKFNLGSPIGEGFFAMLPLNSLGLELLKMGALDASKPDVKFLANPQERPAAIYWWGVFAPGALAAGMALFVEKLTSGQYAGLDIYARPVTGEGRHFLDVLGFSECGKIGHSMAPNLWIFQRKPQVPLYDSYVPHAGKNVVGITVASTFEDLMRVAAIRNAVYIGEQECPYDEEYDGNDLSATHLLAYIGDEPVGCLRLRFFADFAKFERMAIRKEFRKSRAAMQLARAGFQICQKKGYQRVYGHVQERLVSFWSRFGFRVMEGGRKFVFSDHEYVEIIADIERDPSAITIGTDPYIIIRPEGRWHVPGVLEHSAVREIRAAVEKR